MLDKLKEIGFHGIIYSIGSIAQSAASFILFPFYTNYLTTSDFGAFSLIDLYGFLVGSVFYFGITSALPRSYFDHTEIEKRREVFSTGFIILLVGFILQQVFTFALSDSLSYIIFSSYEYTQHIELISISAGLNFVNQYFYSMLRLNRKSLSLSIISLVNLVTTLCVTIYLLSQLKMGIMAPIYGRCIVFSLTCLFLLYSLRSEFIKKFNFNESKLLLHFGIGMVFVNIANISIDWADRFFINKELSLAQVGIYSLAYKLGSVITLVFVAPFEQIWNPMMIDYKDQAGIKDLFSKVFLIFFVLGAFFCACICVGMLIISPILIQSNDFLPALKLSPFISIGILFYGAVNITNAGLVFERKVGKIAKIFYFVSFINLILNYFLISNIGVWGAVLSTMISYLLVPIITGRVSRRFFEVHYKALRVAPVLIVVLAYNYVTSTFFDFDHYITSSILGIGSLIILGVSLFYYYTSKVERTLIIEKIRSKIKVS